MFENILCECLLVKSTKKANELNKNSKNNHITLFYGLRTLG